MVAERTTKAFRPLRGRDGKPSRRTSTKTIWWPQRDSNPRLGLERASPWVVISPTSTPGATARCHSAGSSAAGPRASAVGRSTRARDERTQDFQVSLSIASVDRLLKDLLACWSVSDVAVSSGQLHGVARRECQSG